MIHTLFDKTYLINLGKRKDRLDSVDKKCKKIGLEYTRVEAIDGDFLADPGVDFNTDEARMIRWNINSYALVLTTIGIIKDAMANGYKSILILEDDIDFHAMINSHVSNGFNSLPDDWEMFFLGVANLKDFNMANRYLAKISGALYCHSYAVNHLVYEKYLEVLEKKNKPIDICTMEDIQTRGNSYTIVPSMVIQLTDYSDISKKKEEHFILKHS
jgi:GR25 family glycosyltransferase involved in LPS biosynthesis